MKPVIVMGFIYASLIVYSLFLQIYKLMYFILRTTEKNFQVDLSDGDKMS